MQKTSRHLQDRKDSCDNEKKLREQHEMFREKAKKRNRHGKYHKLN